MKTWSVLAVLSLVLCVVAPLKLVHAEGEGMAQDEVTRANKTMADDQRRLKEEAEQEKKDGAIARARLSSEFGINAAGMSDSEAIVRLKDAVNDRKAASEAEVQKQHEAAEAKQEKARQDLMKKQEAVIKGTFGAGSQDVMDDEDAAEEHMYEGMVQHGVAPQCRGKKGSALIDCVDKAMDAE